MKLGFLGAGNISGMVAPAVQSVKSICRVAVAARNLSDAHSLQKDGALKRRMKATRPCLLILKSRSCISVRRTRFTMSRSCAVWNMERV